MFTKNIEIKKALILFLIIMVNSLSAQTTQSLVFDWVQGFIGEEIQVVEVQVDYEGSIYVLGHGTGNIQDFDPDPNQDSTMILNNQNTFIIKLDTNQNLLWGWGLGHNTEDSRSTDFSLDHLGNVYITGKLGASIDIDPSVSNVVMTDSIENGSYVSKYDKNGNYQWHVQFDDHHTHELIVDYDLNIYISISGDTIDLDPTSGVEMDTSSAVHSYYMIKLNSNGEYLKGRELAFSENPIIGYDIEVDSNNHLYISIRASDSIVLISNDTNIVLANNDLNIWVIESIDSNLNYIWHNSYENGGSYIFIFDLLLSDEQDLYLSGAIKDTVDMDPGPNIDLIYASINVPSAWNGYVSKLSNNGEYLWTRCIDLYETNLIINMAESKMGNISTTGAFFNGTVDFDPGPGENIGISYGYNNYIYTISNEGNYLGATTFEQTGSVDGQSIVYDFNDNLYLGGVFKSTQDFNPSLLSGDTAWLTALDNSTEIYTNSSSFLIKFNICQFTFDTIIANDCEGYTSINGHYYSETGIYFDTILNVSGCDSIVILDLDIVDINTNVSISGTQLTAVSNSTYTYQWLDCTNGFTAISGATNNIYTGNFDGSYALEITKDGCTKRTDCYDIMGVGVEESYLKKCTITPNPTTGKFDLEFTEFISEIEINLVNALGQIVYQTTITNTNHIKLDIGEFSPGIYTLEMNDANSRITKKLVKN